MAEPQMKNSFKEKYNAITDKTNIDKNIQQIIFSNSEEKPLTIYNKAIDINEKITDYFTTFNNPHPNDKVINNVLIIMGYHIEKILLRICSLDANSIVEGINKTLEIGDEKTTEQLLLTNDDFHTPITLRVDETLVINFENKISASKYILSEIIKNIKLCLCSRNIDIEMIHIEPCARITPVESVAPLSALSETLDASSSASLGAPSVTLPVAPSVAPPSAPSDESTEKKFIYNGTHYLKIKKGVLTVDTSNSYTFGNDDNIKPKNFEKLLIQLNDFIMNNEFTLINYEVDNPDNVLKFINTLIHTDNNNFRNTTLYKYTKPIITKLQNIFDGNDIKGGSSIPQTQSQAKETKKRRKKHHHKKNTHKKHKSLLSFLF
jgi:hypothetical protein